MVSNKLTAGAQSLGKAPRFNLQSGLRLRLRESHGLKWVCVGDNNTLLRHKQDFGFMANCSGWSLDYCIT